MQFLSPDSLELDTEALKLLHKDEPFQAPEENKHLPPPVDEPLAVLNDIIINVNDYLQSLNPQGLKPMSQTTAPYRSTHIIHSLSLSIHQLFSFFKKFHYTYTTLYANQEFSDMIEVNDKSVLTLIQPQFALKNKILPLEMVDDVLYVAVTDPGDVILIKDIMFATQKKVKPIKYDEEDIRDAITRYYNIKTIPGLSDGAAQDFSLVTKSLDSTS